ncbi:MAG: response regulator [Verrucomicrobia bacterium]|nr:response regulator [Verrucomicrobiota bacterium]
MKILFVENHAVFAQQVTTQFLGEHEVKIVPSLADARIQIGQTVYELILVDYDLDDGKGAELIRELRTAGHGVRIIGVSAREEGNKAMLEAGANAICSKMKFDHIREFI